MPWTKANEGYRKEAKVPDNWLRRLQNSPKFKIPAKWCCAAVQENSKVTWFGPGDEQEKSNLPDCLEKLQSSKRSGRKWLIRWSIENITSVQSSQLLLQVSTWKIYSGRTELSTCGKWLLLWRLRWKLTSCLGDISLFLIGILYKVFLIWSHVVRDLTYCIVLISLVSKQ